MVPCPARPRRSAGTSSNLVKSNSTHLILPLSLQLPGRCIQTQAIIDSRACSCFTDCTFAKQHQIPLQTKAQHLKIHLANGSNPRSGPITHKTFPLLAVTSIGYVEYLNVDNISSPLFPDILVIPWLQAHNPQIISLVTFLIFL